jgi:hypothetical protein
MLQKLVRLNIGSSKASTSLFTVPKVVSGLAKSQIGVEAMKTFGDQPIERLHCSTTLPTSVVVTGIDSTQVLDQAIEAARRYKPMTKDEISALLVRTRNAALHGQFELY